MSLRTSIGRSRSTLSRVSCNDVKRRASGSRHPRRWVVAALVLAACGRTALEDPAAELLPFDGGSRAPDGGTEIPDGAHPDGAFDAPPGRRVGRPVRGRCRVGT